MSIRHFLGPYKDLPNSLFIIFFARVVNSAGHFVTPLMTIFLTDRLHLNTEETGFFLMLISLAYVPGSMLGGKLADKLGRKKVFICFQSLAACSFIPCAFLGDSILIPWLLIFSSLFGGAASPANSAIVADLTDSSNRREAYSLLYLGHNLGFAIGPLMAGFLYRRFLPLIFLGDAVTTFISIMLVILFIPETMPDQESMAEAHVLDSNERAERGGLLVALFKRPILVMFILTIMLYSFVYVQSYFTLPLQMSKIFGVKDTAYFGLLMTTNALTVVFCTTLIAHLTKKLKPIFCVGLGGLFYAVGFGMLFYIENLYLFVFSTFIWTLGEILIGTNGMTYVANNTPISHRGRFNAIFPIVAEAGHSVGPLLTGKYLLSHPIPSVWQLTLYGSLGTACLLFLLQSIETLQSRQKEQAQV
ncbi:MAG: MFS transporter [Thermotaleaceae bacterium]